VQRTAVAVSALLAFVLGITATGAGSEPVARPSALRLLETLRVPVTSDPSRLTTTHTTLRKGARYSLIVTGTIASQYTRSDGVTIGESEDAFYCYNELNEPAVDPSISCSKHIRRLDALRTKNGGFVEDALGLPRLSIGYQKSHRYALSFKARLTGKLSFSSVKLPVQSPSGSFTLQLYGAGATTKIPKPKKKRRPQVCQARASSSTAGSCHWVVNFTVTQQGLPTSSFPAPDAFFTTSQTDGVGKVFFKKKPKLGRTVTGSAAALFVHTDTFQSPANPFLFEEGELDLKAVSGQYTQLPGGANLLLTGEVTSVSGRAYSTDYEVQPRDKGYVRLISDPPTHRNDKLRVQANCRACGGIGVGHVHQYEVSSQNKLRVTVSNPQPR
jgi:hypothetical protein